MVIDPGQLDRRTRNGLINGLVGPRPIAWVSSLAPDGSRNHAPFSFFGAFSFDPPTIALGPGSRQGVIHVRDDAIDGMVPDPEALDLVGRPGGDRWCTTRDRFVLPRPGSGDPDQVRGELRARLEKLEA